LIHSTVDGNFDHLIKYKKNQNTILLSPFIVLQLCSNHLSKISATRTCFSHRTYSVEHVTFVFPYFESNVFYLCSSLYGATVIFRLSTMVSKQLEKQHRSIQFKTEHRHLRLFASVFLFLHFAGLHRMGCCWAGVSCLPRLLTNHLII
jgi:hypothetical protein